MLHVLLLLWLSPSLSGGGVGVVLYTALFRLDASMPTKCWLLRQSFAASAIGPKRPGPLRPEVEYLAEIARALTTNLKRPAVFRS